MDGQRRPAVAAVPDEPGERAEEGAEGTAAQALRRLRGARHATQTITGTAIGMICGVSQKASPSTRPKSPTRTRSGLLDDAEPEQEQEAAVEDVGRIEALRWVNWKMLKGGQTQKRAPATSAAGSPIVRLPDPPDHERGERREEDRDRCGARGSWAREPRTPARSAAPPGGRRRASPRRTSRTGRAARAAPSARPPTRPSSGCRGAERYHHTRRATPPSPASATSSPQRESASRRMPCQRGSADGPEPHPPPTRSRRSSRIPRLSSPRLAGADGIVLLNASSLNDDSDTGCHASPIDTRSRWARTMTARHGRRPARGGNDGAKGAGPGR